MHYCVGVRRKRFRGKGGYSLHLAPIALRARSTRALLFISTCAQTGPPPFVFRLLRAIFISALVAFNVHPHGRPFRVR